MKVDPDAVKEPVMVKMANSLTGSLKFCIRYWYLSIVVMILSAIPVLLYAKKNYIEYLDDQFFEAKNKNDAEKVISIQNSFFYPSDTYKDKAIHLAVEFNDLAFLKQCLENGDDIDLLNRDGETPLHHAMRNSNYQIFEYLVKNGSNLQIQTRYKDSVLHLAAFSSLEKVKLLVNKGIDINIKDNNGETPLFRTYKKIKIFNYLISIGADINVKNTQNRSLLHMRYISEEIMELLIKAGLDVNAKDNEGTTPIFQMRNINNIKILIENGAKVNISNKFNTLLIQHMPNDIEIIKVLLENGADPNIVGSYGRKALSYCKRNRDRDIAKRDLLLKYGAKYDLYVLFTEAIGKDDLEFVKKKLEEKIELNKLTGEKTLLDLAESPEMKTLLKEHGAKTFHDLKVELFK
ncbi:MAG: ankyrin repeat domain-containing protein [Lentisphaeria bacterium]|nr:ankyrin repeat domain-containing protein [Lentisphaeria bacterium]NQZ68562.1 ankyrin repeat domain-containing protein [Lentisphaeria bacterium]